MPSVNQETIHQIINVVLEHEKPERVYLFGSRVQGNNRSKSDIDIAIDDKDVEKKVKCVVREQIDEKVRTLLNIDLMWFVDLSEQFRENIIKNGVQIYGK